MEASTEYQDGQDAYRRGKSVMDNPYILGGASRFKAWNDWRSGWLDAQKAKSDERKAHRKRLNEECM